MQDDFSAVEKLVLSRLWSAAKEAKPIRDAVSPGNYHGEMVARIRYGVTVSQDYTQKVAARIPWQRICAILFGKVNTATLESVVRAAMDPAFEPDKEIETRARAAVESILGTTKQTCAGRVSLTATAVPVVSAAIETEAESLRNTFQRNRAALGKQSR